MIYTTMCKQPTRENKCKLTVCKVMGFLKKKKRWLVVNQENNLHEKLNVTNGTKEFC